MKLCGNTHLHLVRNLSKESLVSTWFNQVKKFQPMLFLGSCWIAFRVGIFFSLLNPWPANHPCLRNYSRHLILLFLIVHGFCCHTISDFNSISLSKTEPDAPSNWNPELGVKREMHMIDPNNDKKMFLITESWNGLGQTGRLAIVRSGCAVFSLKCIIFY